MRQLLFVLCFAATQAWSVTPDEILDDPGLEARARELSKGLRCVVCRNQSIDDSNAGIARDMRVVLRERLVAGDTDDEALGYLVDRYGQYILLKPPFNAHTYLLWGGPGIILLLTVFGFAGLWRRRNTTRHDEVSPLSDSDRYFINQLLNEEKSNS
ncbi:cytochrome c-type biogenesis protein CcmH [Ruegeria pomeroyi]|nr:cytochrome c-type biogenesis protein CcmH [Ruegeria pomeroyi]MCE8534618.1 cytochrome c-type biogenesis protein CcmH [Ruegeria pomeroyi]